ncbi:MAG TPA: hypothetical protein PLH63_05415 [Candidatus Cloacimonadota bacterium]|nr:hypothetical protein [Candidatus Cloacimonadota bacterium]
MIMTALAVAGAGASLWNSRKQNKEENKERKQMREALDKQIAADQRERGQLGISSQEAAQRAGQMLAKYRNNPEMQDRVQSMYTNQMQANHQRYQEAGARMAEARAERGLYGKKKMNWGSAIMDATAAGISAATGMMGIENQRQAATQQKELNDIMLKYYKSLAPKKSTDLSYGMEPIKVNDLMGVYDV